MALVTFQGRQYPLQEQETVLDGLLRHSIPIPNSCRSGVCQACLMQAVSGSVPSEAQQGLKPTWREQQYFLACKCHTDQDIEVVLPGAQLSPPVQATVLSKVSLNDQIVQLRLQCQQPFEYRAGQFIHLYHGEDRTLIRSYSLASVPVLDQALEIHVRHVPGGRMSNWIHEKVRPEQQLLLSGPHGECYYVPADAGQGLLLLATGCGLAPLWGIVRDALEQGHTGPIRLFHGGRSARDLYLVDEIQTLADNNGQFSYFPCLDGGEGDLAGGQYYSGKVQDQALKYQPDLQGWRVYLCGNPAMVNEAKRRAFLAGAALTDIHADPFISPCRQSSV